MMLFGEELDTIGWIGIIGAAASAIVAVGGVCGTFFGIWLKGQRDKRIDSVKDYREMAEALQKRVDVLEVTREKERETDRATHQKELAEARVDWRHEVHQAKEDAQAKLSKSQVEAMQREQELQRLRREDTKDCDHKLEVCTQRLFQQEREKSEMAASIARLETEIKVLTPSRTVTAAMVTSESTGPTLMSKEP